jgi:hypothetical protein
VLKQRAKKARVEGGRIYNPAGTPRWISNRC